MLIGTLVLVLPGTLFTGWQFHVVYPSAEQGGMAGMGIIIFGPLVWGVAGSFAFALRRWPSRVGALTAACLAGVVAALATRDSSDLVLASFIPLLGLAPGAYIGSLFVPKPRRPRFVSKGRGGATTSEAAAPLVASDPQTPSAAPTQGTSPGASRRRIRRRRLARDRPWFHWPAAMTLGAMAGVMASFVLGTRALTAAAIGTGIIALYALITRKLALGRRSD